MVVAALSSFKNPTHLTASNLPSLLSSGGPIKGIPENLHTSVKPSLDKIVQLGQEPGSPYSYTFDHSTFNKAASDPVRVSRTDVHTEIPQANLDFSHLNVVSGSFVQRQNYTAGDIGIEKDFAIDKRGRSCQALKLPAEFKDLKEFTANASPSLKLAIFDKIREMTKGTTSYRMVVDAHPGTGNLRFYVATTTDPNYKNNNWEANGVEYRGKPGTVTNNPLFEKAKKGLKTTTDTTENFVMFPSIKKDVTRLNHPLIVPTQSNKFANFEAFLKDASPQMKIELLDLMAKHIDKDRPISYINAGRAQHIPWLHIHVLKGEDAKKKVL